MAIADIESVGMPHKTQKFQHVVVVVKGLADAHHNDIGDAFPKIAGGGDDLSQKLGGDEVAHLAVNGGGAEATAHTTAYL